MSAATQPVLVEPVHPGQGRQFEPVEGPEWAVDRDAFGLVEAESTIVLIKNEAIRDYSPFRNGPLKTLDEVEWVTMAWVDRCNSRRLHATLGEVLPGKLEASYCATLKGQSQREMEPA